MRTVRIVGGEHPGFPRIIHALTESGWRFDSTDPAPGLTIFSASPADRDWTGAFDALLQTPVRTVEAMVPQLPDAALDAGGERRAPALALLLWQPEDLVPGVGAAPRIAACAAARAWMRDSAQTFAPRLRVNALVLSGQESADRLLWILSAHAVTGQVIGAGTLPRPATAWRAAPRLRQSPTPL